MLSHIKADTLQQKKILKSLQDFWQIFLCYSLFVCLHSLNAPQNRALSSAHIFLHVFMEQLFPTNCTKTCFCVMGLIAKNCTK